MDGRLVMDDNQQQAQLQLQIDDLRRQLSALDTIVGLNHVKTNSHINTVSLKLMAAIDLQSDVLKKFVKAMLIMAEKLNVIKTVGEVLDLDSTKYKVN